MRSKPRLKFFKFFTFLIQFLELNRVHSQSFILLQFEIKPKEFLHKNPNKF